MSKDADKNVNVVAYDMSEDMKLRAIEYTMQQEKTK